MNIMKLRPLFFFVSSLAIIASVSSMIFWGFKPSIDFSGGSIIEFKSSVITRSSLEDIFNDQSLSIRSILQNADTYVVKFDNINQDQKESLSAKLLSLDESYTELRFETLGPILGKELLQKTIYAVILSSLALLIFIGSRFKDLSFGISAVLAMLHDATILIGSFSIFGHFFGAELDSLFVTALLTTLSASVHDTVVTFDRIRELKSRNYKLDWTSLANKAVTETIVRSLNNSMTIIFMLFSLVMLGGGATRWFATALLVGVVCGTYSSTAVAIPLVLFWKKNKNKT